MDRGYVRLWRKSLDSGMIQNHQLWVFWTWCLMKASHAPRSTMVGMQMVDLKPGQFVFGRKVASRELGISEQTIRTILKKLKTLKNLTIKSTNKFSVITIVKWGSYQQEQQEISQPINPQVTNNQPASNHKQELKHYSIKENNTYPDGYVSTETPSTPPCPHQKIRNLYNQSLPELPQCKSTNQTFDKNLRARWREDQDRQCLDWWAWYFKIVRESDFLMGRTSNPFQCSFDWLIKPTNMSKVINGNYQNRVNGGFSDMPRRSNRDLANIQACMEFIHGK